MSLTFTSSLAGRQALVRSAGVALLGGLLLAGCGGESGSGAVRSSPSAAAPGSTAPGEVSSSATSATVAPGSSAPTADGTASGEGAAEEPVDADGAWETDYGRLTFTTEGTRFSGTYDTHDGTLTGTITGGTVSGDWFEPHAEKECDSERRGTRFWGSFTFEFAEDGRSFDGTWGYCDEPPSDVWSGRLLGP